MKKKIAFVLCAAVVATSGVASDQFSMSDADKAMYEELLDNNPADLMLANGEELLGKYCGGAAGVAKFFGVSEKKLPAYIAGFPRYLKDFKMVVGLDQALQGLMHQNGHKPFALKSQEMFEMSSFAKSLANGEKINIDVKANKEMKEAYALGKHVFEERRGGRGLSCYSCHNKETIGMILRTQQLPDLGAKETKSAATWPAYRMTKSALTTLPKRFQGCMENALLAVIPLGSKEMVALEVYVSDKSKGHVMALPGIKR